MRPYIAVVGASEADDSLYERLERSAACWARATPFFYREASAVSWRHRAAERREWRSQTVAILPSMAKQDANDFVDVAFPTGMGEMRNALIVRAADAVIAVGGGFGTLSEIAFALRTTCLWSGSVPGTWQRTVNRCRRSPQSRLPRRPSRKPWRRLGELDPFEVHPVRDDPPAAPCETPAVLKDSTTRGSMFGFAAEGVVAAVDVNGDAPGVMR